jgi:hypothetical protein
MSGSSTLNAASAPAGLDVLATNMANHAVLERGLQTELTGHLGYAKGDPEDRLLPNFRNGFSETTACNEIGDVTLAIPRPRWRSAPSPRPRLASTSAASSAGKDSPGKPRPTCTFDGVGPPRRCGAIS